MVELYIDYRRCEGQGPCVDVCPVDVLELRPPAHDLPLATQLRVRLHGGKQAFLIGECIGCGKCVPVCPTQALTLYE